MKCIFCAFQSDCGVTMPVPKDPQTCIDANAEEKPRLRIGESAEEAEAGLALAEKRAYGDGDIPDTTFGNYEDFE